MVILMNLPLHLRASSPLNESLFFTIQVHASPSLIVFPLLNHEWGKHESLPCITMGVTNTHLVEPLLNHGWREYESFSCSSFCNSLINTCPQTIGFDTTCSGDITHWGDSNWIVNITHRDTI